MAAPPDDLRADLETGAGDDLVALGERLLANRPRPNPTFRGDLGRRLAPQPPRRLGRTRVGRLIAAYSTSGTLLLVLGAVSVSGHGPL